MFSSLTLSLVTLYLSLELCHPFPCRTSVRHIKPDVISLMPSNLGPQAINMAEMAESQRTVKNLFQDDRFGEEDEEMSVEDKMLRRFQKERAVSL